MRASVRRPSVALAKLCECDLLPAGEERRLFRHLKEAREASVRRGEDGCRRAGDGRHSHSTARATAIRNRIALSNLRLVVSVAKRFASPQQSLEDLVSELDVYLKSSHESPEEVVRTWQRLEPYRIAVPTEVNATIARLFISNLRLALAILRFRQEPNPPRP